MTVVEKLVYLIRQGAIAPEQIAPGFREEVAAALAAERAEKTE